MLNFHIHVEGLKRNYYLINYIWLSHRYETRRVLCSMTVLTSAQIITNVLNTRCRHRDEVSQWQNGELTHLILFEHLQN
jgi:hypothetical protein